MNSKLVKDFGVRALLAALSVLGLYEVILAAFVLIWVGKVNASFSDVLALIAVAQAPATMALAFYFGMRMASPP